MRSTGIKMRFLWPFLKVIYLLRERPVRLSITLLYFVASETLEPFDNIEFLSKPRLKLYRTIGIRGVG